MITLWTSPARALPPLALAASALLLTGCRADFSADVRNQTSQPVYVQLFERHEDSRMPIIDSMRLGPGDRGTIGPVRAGVGRVILVVDTKANPQGPGQADLRPGKTIMNVLAKPHAPNTEFMLQEVDVIK